ncbi:hypothetical protein [Lentzea kentuckyensis]|uniref:hypothetical protein n=1 Tax=Lentzea kentuckyensis TaxID=360086 RepID=UPI000A3CA512|nr:hypothetical protein [Lentzea kentuckyensis]
MLRIALVILLFLPASAHALPLKVSCKVPGVHDADVIRVVHAVGLSLRVSDKVMLAGFEAGWVESHMNNLACGDADSLGVFQQRPSMGWGTPAEIMDVPYAARRFFEYAVKVDRPDLSPGLLADAVQRSCCPERYDQAVARAESMLRQAWQGGPEVVGGVYVVEDGDVWVDRTRLSTIGSFIGRPSVAGRFVYARTVRGEVMVLADGSWRLVASGVGGDPEAVLRPDGTVVVYAVLADGSVAKLSDPSEMIGMGGRSPQGARQSGSIPLSPPGFAAGKPSAITFPDGSIALYLRSGSTLVAGGAGAWREIAQGLEASPEAVLRPDGTVGVYSLIGGRVHRLGAGWEPLGEARFIDTVSAQPEGTVYARKADGEVVKVG